MDSQQTELVGRAYLTTQLLIAGFEVAKPERDKGIDLIVYSDVRGEPFRAVPLQLKAASSRIFSVNRKYIGRGIVMAYIWRVLQSQPRLFLVDHDVAVQLLPEARRETQSWRVDGRWEDTHVGADLEAALVPFENFDALKE